MKPVYTIDAEGRALGRVASEAAVYLLGKTTPDFQKNAVKSLSVKIVNAGKMKITQKKSKTKIYTTYTGYPGGLKQKTMEQVVAKKGVKEIIEHAVKGMLPKNRLQTERMKNLIVVE